MVVMSIEEYSRLIDSVELALDVADEESKSHTKRLTHEQVFETFKCNKALK